MEAEQTPWPQNIYATSEKELAEKIGLRVEVLRFALLMEAELQKHDHDRGVRGWKESKPLTLFHALMDEVYELSEEIRGVRDGGIPAAKEAADVANFAMMIADVCGGLKR